MSVKKLNIAMLALAVATVLYFGSSQKAFAATDTEVADALQNGISYLAAHQNADGSIAGYGGETEWSTIAVESTGQNAQAVVSNEGNSLVDSIVASPPQPEDSATTIERDILALAAAGQDTKNVNGTNYNQLLAAQGVGGQIGDPSLINDDIFGVLAAASTDDPSLKPLAQDGLNYFLSYQGEDGGFSYTTQICDFFCGEDSNDTAAAIVAMSAAKTYRLGTEGLDRAQASALTFLLGTQKADGGFGYDALSPSDGSSTAWGLIALNAIGDAVQAQAGLARDWLLKNQNSDGGFSYGAWGVTESDTYTTAHALIALAGTDWLLTRPKVIINDIETMAGIQASIIAKTSESIAPIVKTQAAFSPISADNSSVMAASTEGALLSSSARTSEAPATNTPSTSQVSRDKASYIWLALVMGIAAGWYKVIKKKEEGSSNDK